MGEWITWLERWPDLLWIIPVLAVTPPRHWPVAAAYVVCCAVMLRLMLELLNTIGYGNGFLFFPSLPGLKRGFITYGISCAFLIILGAYARRTQRIIFMAACMSLFFMASLLTLIALVL